MKDIESSITRIQELTILIQKISSGDFSARAGKTPGDDAIDALATGINAMIEDLNKRTVTIEYANNRIEEILNVIQAVAGEDYTVSCNLTEKNDIFDALGMGINMMIDYIKSDHDALVRRTDELARSNADLQNFTNIASHDLQEPLRKITAFGGRLKEKYGGALDGQGRDYLDRMLNAAVRMQGLIDSLLTYSRITAASRPFIKTDLNGIVKEVLSDLEVRIDQVKGKAEAGPLPAIEADPVQMRQLFQNLIGNALKFHKPGAAPTVRIYSSIINNAAGETCEITVEDDGIGIDGKYHDRIFGMFQRLHGRDEYEGNGVGLALCKKIAERHGGGIRVESKQDMGSRFMVRLPVKHHHSGVINGNP